MACRAWLFNWQHLSWALCKIIWDFITGVHFAQVITTVACVKIHYTVAESYTYVLPATSFCYVWWNAVRNKQKSQSLCLNFLLVLNSPPPPPPSWKGDGSIEWKFREPSNLLQRGKQRTMSIGFNKSPTIFFYYLEATFKQNITI